MALKINLLFASGDIGGARAIIPLIKAFERNSFVFFYVPHGHIVRESDDLWRKASITQASSEIDIESFLSINNIDCFVFATSVKDDLALRIALVCGKLDIPTVHVLDNWTSYIERLKLANGDIYAPDVYTVIDELAYHDAVEAGVKPESLYITGQPAHDSIKEEMALAMSSYSLQQNLERTGLSIDKRVILFVSEPVEDDNGQTRGYTEKTVLELLCKYYQSESSFIQMLILPHPRENRDLLKKVWERWRGNIDGSILNLDNGRHALNLADGVVGMASVLLYEAWLMGLPVASIQPDLKLDSLRMLSRREGVIFIDSYEKINFLSEFSRQIENKSRRSMPSGFGMNCESSEKIIRIVEKLVTEKAMRKEVLF